MNSEELHGLPEFSDARRALSMISGKAEGLHSLGLPDSPVVRLAVCTVAELLQSLLSRKSTRGAPLSADFGRPWEDPTSLGRDEPTMVIDSA